MNGYYWYSGPRWTDGARKMLCRLLRSPMRVTVSLRNPRFCMAKALASAGAVGFRGRINHSDGRVSWEAYLLDELS